MKLSSPVYNVPASLRLLAAAGAVAVLASLPTLVASGAVFQTLAVAGAGLFSASIALFGGQVRN